MTTVGTDIGTAVGYLRAGAIVGLPTETVYGLGVCAYDAQAVEALYRLKGRPRDHPLIVHIQDRHAMDGLVRGVPVAAQALATAFWPGPLTLVLPHAGQLCEQVSAGLPTLALRAPQHPLMQSVLEQASFPVAVPSANRFGALSPTCSAHVQAQFGEAIPYILEGGKCSWGIESSIVGFDGDEPVLYRTGALTKESLEAVLKHPVRVLESATKALAPGMHKRHYAPRKPLAVGHREDLLAQFRLEEAGMLCFQQPCQALPQTRQIVLSRQGTLVEAARNFFAALHRLENKDIAFILAEWLPHKDIGLALNDRLRRAAYPPQALKKYRQS